MAFPRLRAFHCDTCVNADRDTNGGTEKKKRTHTFFHLTKSMRMTFIWSLITLIFSTLFRERDSSAADKFYPNESNQFPEIKIMDEEKKKIKEK